MVDEEVDEAVTEEVSDIDDVSEPAEEQTGFGMGSVADGSEDPIVDLSLIHI